MEVSLSPEFIAKFPEYIRLSLVVQGADNTKQIPKLETCIREELAHGRISSWQEAFRRFGADPEEHKPSVQALLERIREGHGMASHNPIVDIANYISLKYLVPCGADDLDKIDGDFGLKLARGDEIFVSIGSSRVERPEPGEVIYADKHKVLCRRWVWRQGIHSMVDESTVNAVINIDVLPPVSREEGQKALDELTAMVQKYCGGKVFFMVLDKDHPEAEISLPSERRRAEENIYDTLELRGYIEQTSDRIAVRDFLAPFSAPTTIYEGFDPTKPSLHVGHLMSLMVMHYLQEAGHRVIFILGGGTAQIGDPSGRTKGREMISPEEVRENGEAIKRQVQQMGLLNFEEDRPGAPAAIMLDNIEWLNMPLLEYAREITPHFSVNAMVKREDFQRRLSESVNLSLFEFIYTTLQSYDFLYLYDRYGCTIQMGGNDQWVNIVDGVNLIRRKRNGKAYAMTFPLLMDRTGQKMGKTSAGKTIWLAAEGPYSTSPFEFYQYWVNSPDDDLERNFKIFTFLPLDEIDDILAGDPREAQHRLAYEVTKIVHGEEIARRVQDDALRAFGRLKGLPKNVPTFVIDEQALARGLTIRDVLVQSGAVSSRSEAKRLLEQGAIRVNNRKVTGVQYTFSPEDFMAHADEKAALVRYGKGKVLKVTLQ